MKIFADTSDLEEVKKMIAVLGDNFHGVTTNPSLLREACKKYNIDDMHEYLIELSSAIGPRRDLSLQAIGPTRDEMIQQGIALDEQYNKYSNPSVHNVVVKVPINSSPDGSANLTDGYEAIKVLAAQGIRVNATLVFSTRQAVAAAHAGASFISPFVGRVDDMLGDIAKEKGIESCINRKKTDYYYARGFEGVTDENGLVSGVELVAAIDKSLYRYGYDLRQRTHLLAASLRNPTQVFEAAWYGADIATLPVPLLYEMLTIEQRLSFDKDDIQARIESLSDAVPKGELLSPRDKAKLCMLLTRGLVFSGERTVKQLRDARMDEVRRLYVPANRDVVIGGSLADVEEQIYKEPKRWLTHDLGNKGFVRFFNDAKAAAAYDDLLREIVALKPAYLRK